MDSVFIKDLRVEMSIGITSVERAKCQPVLMTIEMHTDTTKAAASGDVSDSVDYYTVAKDVKALALSRHFDLLETLAEDVAALCLSKAHVKSVNIEVEKPNIMSGLCASVGVKVKRP